MAKMLKMIEKKRPLLARIAGYLVRRPCEFCGATTPALEPYCSTRCARQARHFDLNP